jgi:hypothetical protein
MQKYRNPEKQLILWRSDPQKSTNKIVSAFVASACRCTGGAVPRIGRSALESLDATFWDVPSCVRDIDIWKWKVEAQPFSDGTESRPD